MSVVDRSYGHPLKVEEEATAPLAGGIMQYGYQCGMLWGATLAAGAQAYRLFGTGPQAETRAVVAAQRLVESFRNRNKNTNCLEIIEIDLKPSSRRQFLLQFLKFFIKGGPVGCFRMAAAYAHAAFHEINTSLSEETIIVPDPPISCAAMLAQKMGLSDRHTVMAAGLAGGIGLSGGACGALGTAIWISAMNSQKEGISRKAIDSRINDGIDEFIRSTDFEFECSEITGRNFENVTELADYLRQGGCSAIMESLSRGCFNK